MNNQLSINIFLTEKFLGKCWHEEQQLNIPLGSKPDIKYFCKKCRLQVSICNSVLDYNIDLFTPTGFFLLWEKAQGEEWWVPFGIFCGRISLGEFPQYAINPLTFPTLLAEYLGWKDNN